MSSFASRFLEETDGAMTILALIFFVILVGFAGLAIDIGRVYGLRGQMVSYVDQVALAAATELDGQSGSIDRAARAALGDDSGGPLVSTSYNFAQPSTTLGVYNLIFLSHIASGPGPTPQTGDTVVCTYQGGAWSPASCDKDATINGKAKLVAVTSTSVQVGYFVLPVADFLLGAGAMAGGARIQMQATAGYTSWSCDITPLMMCNPSEPAGNTDTLYPYNPTIGQQILMKASGSGAAWAPGDFGLLQQPSTAGGSGCNGAGASFIQCMLGLVNPLTQCFQTNVTVQPGQAQTTSDGINARFDIYAQSGSKYSGNALFAPSADVTKGIVGKTKGSCPNQFQAATAGVPLPRDANIMADTTGTVRFGNGVAYSAVTKYWSTDHPTSPTVPTSIQTACQTAGTACRYAIYRYEIDNNLVPNIKNGENGAPMCTVPGVNDAQRDRRTLIMAVVNCGAVNLRGKTANTGSYSGIPVTSIVKMFMTEPMGLQEDATGKVTGDSSSSNNIYGEVLGTVTPGDTSGALHVIPVLYR
jgi:hypothetical protein